MTLNEKKPKNVGNLGLKGVTSGYNKVTPTPKIAQSGHTVHISVSKIKFSKKL